MTTQERAYHEQILNLVVQETANAYGVQFEQVRTQNCDPAIVTTAVSLLVDTGVDEDKVLSFFGQDSDWLEEQKEKFASIKNTDKYSKASEIVQGTLMACELDAASALGNGSPVTSSQQSGSTQLPPSRKTPRAQGVPQRNVCSAILENAAKYFEVPQATFFYPSTAEHREWREKIAKAMSLCGAKEEEILSHFPNQNGMWLKDILQKVDDDDGDVEMIKVTVDNAASTSFAKSAPAAPAPSKDGVPQEKICSAVLAKAEKHFGVSQARLLNPQNGDEVIYKNKCVKAMVVSGATNIDIRQCFDIRNGNDQWAQSQIARVSDNDSDVEKIRVTLIKPTPPPTRPAAPAAPPVAAPTSPTVQAPKPTSGSYTAKEICGMIAARGALRFQVSVDVIKNPSGWTQKGYRSKCVKAMRVCGVKIDDILTFFGAGYIRWYYNQVDELKDDDADVAALVEGLTVSGAKPERNGHTKESKASATGSPAPKAGLSPLVERIAQLLGRDIESLKNGGDRQAVSDRNVAAVTLKDLEYPQDDILKEFKKSYPWLWSAKKNLSPTQESQVQELIKKLKGEVPPQAAPVRTPVAPPVASPPPAPFEDEELPPREEKAVAVQSETRTVSKPLKALSEKVFEEFCGADMMFSPHPMEQLALAKDAMILVAAIGTVPPPFDEIKNAFSVEEDQIYNVVGRLTIRMRNDPAFARKIKSIQRA